MAPIGLCLALATAAETHCRMAETCSKENERATRRGCSNNGYTLVGRRPPLDQLFWSERDLLSPPSSRTSRSLLWCGVASLCAARDAQRTKRGAECGMWTLALMSVATTAGHVPCLRVLAGWAPHPAYSTDAAVICTYFCFCGS